MVSNKGYTIKAMASMFGITGKSKDGAMRNLCRVAFAEEFGEPVKEYTDRNVIFLYNTEHVDALVARYRAERREGETVAETFRRIFNKPTRKGPAPAQRNIVKADRIEQKLDRILEILVQFTK